MKILWNLSSCSIVGLLFLLGCSDEKSPAYGVEDNSSENTKPSATNIVSAAGADDPQREAVESEISKKEEEVLPESPQNPATRDAARRGAMSKFQQTNPPVKERQ